MGLLLHMGLGPEAVRQNLGQRPFRAYTILAYEIHPEIIRTEFPHDLAADSAGREHVGNDPVFAAADGDGGEFPMAVIDCLEKGRPLGAVGGSVGSVFNVAPLFICDEAKLHLFNK